MNCRCAVEWNGPDICVGSRPHKPPVPAGTIWINNSTDTVYVRDEDDWKSTGVAAWRMIDWKYTSPDTSFLDDLRNPTPLPVTCPYCGRVWREGARGWDGVTCWDGWQGCGASLLEDLVPCA